MKRIILSLSVLFALNVSAQEHQGEYTPKQPPIPVEVFVGENSSMYQMIVSKQITPGSKFGFFNLINYEVAYDEYVPDSYIIQSLFNYQIVKGLNIGAGANFKAFGGFKPLVSASYSFFNKDFSFLVQPSYEIDKDGSLETFALFEWHPVNQKKIQPYFRLQGLASLNSEHTFSYHNWRAGIQYNMFIVGPAFNMQYVGPDAISNTNFGGFLTILID